MVCKYTNEMVTREEEPLKPELEPPPESETRKTFKEKFELIRDNITVEPVLVCFIVSGMLTRLATENLQLDKACRVHKGYGDEVCDALIAKEGNPYAAEEIAVQELVSGMDVWKNTIFTSVPCILILFLGAWSDRTGKRKICILIPLIGDVLMCISNITNVYFFYELPVQVVMFFEAFFSAITGSWIVVLMGAFSYISDITSEETRTFRVGVANLCLTVGNPIGTALSGILLKQIGYYGVYSLSLLLYFFSAYYVVFRIKDVERSAPIENQGGPKSCIKFLKSFFALKHVKDTFAVAFKKGPKRRRTKFILILLAMAFVNGPTYGDIIMRYLFCRTRFNWDAMKYGIYSTFYIYVHSLGGLISITIFSRRLGWDDSVLGLISTVSKVAGDLTTALARNTLEMYLAVVIETFNATSLTVTRSISSKLVSSDELGKMIALFNLVEILSYLVFGAMFPWVYMETVHVDSGIIYYVSICFTVVPIAIFCWFYKQYRHNYRESRTEKNIEMDTMNVTTD